MQTETSPAATGSDRNIDWLKLVLLIYEKGPCAIDENSGLSRRIVSRAYQHLIEKDYPYLDDLDEALDRNGHASRRRHYRIQKDHSGRLVIVLPVDFLNKGRGDRVRVEFAHGDEGRSISLF